MSALPDVNLLLAVGWASHTDHAEAKAWLFGLERFATCPITELGFLRVSMTPGYRADFASAMTVLEALKNLPAAEFLPATESAATLLPVSRYRDTTDAYLVALAQAHGCRLATLDEALLAAPWAQEIAFHPLR